jgi:hypothetical protein
MSRPILGFDPGATIGWAIYDPQTQQLLEHGEFDAVAPGVAAIVDLVGGHDGPIAIERPRVYSGRDKEGVIKHAAGNDVADTCEQCGWLVALAGGELGAQDLGHGAWARGGDCYLLERRAVTRAVRRHFGEAIVGDGPIWKALRDAHGGEAAMAGPKAGTPAKWTKGRKGKPATSRSPGLPAVAPELLAAEVPAREPGHLHGMGGHARAAFATAWALGQFLTEGK